MYFIHLITALLFELKQWGASGRIYWFCIS